LIVDDERDLVEMLAMRLKASGDYDVDSAFDGVAGLEKAQASHPDIVLLDAYMPRMDGWEVCRRLCDNPATQDIAVVMMTAGHSRQTQAQAKQAGALEIISKPFDTQEIASALQSIDFGSAD